MKIKLGNRVRDVYTGFEGIATGRTEWLYGCARITIEPTELDKDGKLLDSQWFDEQRIELVKTKKKRITKESRAKTGGPQDDPKHSLDPKR
jgi:hypothetical protein